MTPQFSLMTVKTYHGFRIRCIVTDGSNEKKISEPALLSVAYLCITEHPEDATVNVGETSQFHVKAIGTDLTYQWQYSSDNGINWKNFSTKHTTAFTQDFSLKAVRSYDDFLIRCKVMDAYKNIAFSSPTLLSVVSLKITSQPEDAYAMVGTNAQFHITAEGEGLGYQWQYSSDNGINWRNFGTKHTTATTPDFSLKMAASYDKFKIRCIVRNGSGETIVSKIAILHLAASIVITEQPVNTTVSAGETAQFHIAATGDALQYQWQYSSDNGLNFRNFGTKHTTATTPDFSLKTSASYNGFRIRCKVSNDSGQSVTSERALLTVQ